MDKYIFYIIFLKIIYILGNELEIEQNNFITCAGDGNIKLSTNILNINELKLKLNNYIEVEVEFNPYYNNGINGFNLNDLQFKYNYINGNFNVINNKVKFVSYLIKYDYFELFIENIKLPYFLKNNYNITSILKIKNDKINYKASLISPLDINHFIVDIKEIEILEDKYNLNIILKNNCYLNFNNLFLEIELDIKFFNIFENFNNSDKKIIINNQKLGYIYENNSNILLIKIHNLPIINNGNNINIIFPNILNPFYLENYNLSLKLKNNISTIVSNNVSIKPIKNNEINNFSLIVNKLNKDNYSDFILTLDSKIKFLKNYIIKIFLPSIFTINKDYKFNIYKNDILISNFEFIRGDNIFEIINYKSNSLDIWKIIFKNIKTNNINNKSKNFKIEISNENKELLAKGVSNNFNIEKIKIKNWNITVTNRIVGLYGIYHFKIELPQIPNSKSVIYIKFPKNFIKNQNLIFLTKVKGFKINNIKLVKIDNITLKIEEEDRNSLSYNSKNIEFTMNNILNYGLKLQNYPIDVYFKSLTIDYYLKKPFKINFDRGEIIVINSSFSINNKLAYIDFKLNLQGVVDTNELVLFLIFDDINILNLYNKCIRSFNKVTCSFKNNIITINNLFIKNNIKDNNILEFKISGIKLNIPILSKHIDIKLVIKNKNNIELYNMINTSVKLFCNDNCNICNLDIKNNKNICLECNKNYYLENNNCIKFQNYFNKLLKKFIYSLYFFVICIIIIKFIIEKNLYYGKHFAIYFSIDSNLIVNFLIIFHIVYLNLYYKYLYIFIVLNFASSFLIIIFFVNKNILSLYFVRKYIVTLFISLLINNISIYNIYSKELIEIIVYNYKIKSSKIQIKFFNKYKYLIIFNIWNSTTFIFLNLYYLYLLKEIILIMVVFIAILGLSFFINFLIFYQIFSYNNYKSGFSRYLETNYQKNNKIYKFIYFLNNKNDVII